MRECARQIGGRLQKLACGIGLALFSQDSGEEIGDIRRGADAGDGGAELLLGLVEPAGAVKRPTERGDDLGGPRKLQGIDLGELQGRAIVWLYRVWSSKVRASRLATTESAGAVAMQRLEDRFGGRRGPGGARRPAPEPAEPL